MISFFFLATLMNVSHSVTVLSNWSTPHPDKGELSIHISTDISSEIPELFIVNVDEIKYTSTTSYFLCPDLFDPGEYTILIYNLPNGFQVINDIAYVNITSNGTIEPIPGYLFSGTERILIPADDILQVNSKINQRVGFDLEIMEGDPNIICSFTANIYGIAGQYDLWNEIICGEPMSIFLNFTSNSDTFISKTRLLGTIGDTQYIDLFIEYTNGLTQHIHEDLSEVLVGLNNGMENDFWITGNIKIATDSKVIATTETHNWEIDDTIGITVTNSPNSNMCELYRNIPYIINENSNFMPLDNPMYIIKPQIDEKVLISSYFPYQKDLPEDYLMKMDTSIMQTNERQQMINFMYSNLTLFSESENISFAFQSCMAYIELKIIYETEQMNLWKFSINGLKHNGTFNALNGIASIDEESLQLDDWDITNNIFEENTLAHSKTYKMYIFPQKLDNGFSLTCSYGQYSNKEFFNISELESVKQYEFAIIVSDGEDEPTTSSSDLTNFSDLTHSSDLTNFADLTHSFVFTHSYGVTMTMAPINTFLSDTFLFTYINSTFISTFTELIFYEYGIVRYSTYYNFYSVFLMFYKSNVNTNDKNENTNLIIIIVCVVIAVLLICLLIVLIVHVRNRKENVNSFASSSTNKEEMETPNDLLVVSPVTHIEEDPFAKDFQEYNQI